MFQGAVPIGAGWWIGPPQGIIQARDCILLKQKTKHTLDFPVRPHILRVVEVKDAGVAVLEGSDDRKATQSDPRSQPVPGAIISGGYYTLSCLWAPLHVALQPMQPRLSSQVLGAEARKGF